MRRLAIIAIALAIGVAAAAEPTAESVLARMKTWLEPSRSSVRQFTLVVQSAPGTQVEWSGVQARGQIDGTRYALTVLQEPRDVRGVALLIAEQPGQPTREWLYWPYLRRVREVLPVNEFDSFLGTEFTYADLGFANLQNRSVALLGRDTVNGVPALRVEETPDDRRTFSRIVSWVDPETGQPLRREFFDVANRLWKVATFGGVTMVEGVPTARQIRIEDVQTKYASEYRIEAIRYDVEVPPELFDWQQLPAAADHAFWK